MSSRIYTVIAKADISEEQLKGLIASNGISTGPHTYDGQKLFAALTERYGWKPATEQDNACCLWGSEWYEVMPFVLPDGSTQEVVVKWWDNDGSTHCEALMLYGMDTGDGLFLNRYRKEGDRLEIGFIDGVELWNVCDEARYVYGFQPILRSSELSRREQAFVERASRGHSGQVSVTRTIAVPVEAFE